MVCPHLKSFDLSAVKTAFFMKHFFIKSVIDLFIVSSKNRIYNNLNEILNNTLHNLYKE